MKLKTKKIIAREFILLIIVLIIGVLAFFGTNIYNTHLSNEIDDLFKDTYRQASYIDSLKKPYEGKINHQTYYNQDLYYLKEKDRKKLTAIVHRMIKSGTSEKKIGIIVVDFKNKYALEYDPLHILLPIFIPKDSNVIVYEGKYLFKIDRGDFLYKGLHNSGMYPNSLEDFRNQFNNNSSLDSLFEILSKKQLYTKTKDEFYKQYFPSFSKQSNNIAINENTFSKKDSINQEKVVDLGNKIAVINVEKDGLNDRILSTDQKFGFSERITLLAFILLFPIRILYYSIRWSILTLGKKE